MGFYETLWQYDSLMHFIGGAWIASIIIYLVETRGKFSLSFVSPDFAMLSVSGIVLTIELLWEYLEYTLDTIVLNSYNIALSLQPSIFDTLKDLGIAWIAAILYTIIANKKRG